ncbi:cysteine hydrolase [Enterococcus ureasiticus]|uniref:cysteine hydrolase family protein n=1 Tax=Enterococcus ureasiticus TaxID=903984 RepID=UPI001A8EEEF1|nr:cysteine hydrolase family protein [Enterococcus ureasiticus]MBO0475320.1 cysteine hydrolase [Enterococcus ureasiticus]
MKQALLIIDVQNDYFKGGKMELYLPTEALKIIQRLEAYFIEQKLPIIYIQHVNYQKGAEFFEANTQGVKLHPNLKIKDNSFVVEKQFPNSFFKTELSNLLNENHIEQLVITGMMTHMCVDSTTRAAAELGLHPLLITDTTATRDLIFNGKKVNAESIQTAYLSALTKFPTVMTASDYLNSTQK